jgi:hypothetical protein
MSYQTNSSSDPFGSQNRFGELEKMSRTPRRDQGADSYKQKKVEPEEMQDFQDKYGT